MSPERMVLLCLSRELLLEPLDLSAEFSLHSWVSSPMYKGSSLSLRLIRGQERDKVWTSFGHVRNQVDAMIIDGFMSEKHDKSRGEELVKDQQIYFSHAEYPKMRSTSVAFAIEKSCAIDLL